MITNSFDNVNFTSRCPQIRDAQKVCHKIVADFPHVSSTRMKPLIDDFKLKYPDIYYEFINSNITTGRYSKLKDMNDWKIFSIFKAFCGCKRNVAICRQQVINSPDEFTRTYGIASQLKYLKVGNCYENAKMSELIMRLKGKKNVYTGILDVNGRKIDHIVCFFDKNGKPFNGKIDKNTIIVDSWIGEVDFADNMLQKYRSIYKNFLSVPDKGKMKFDHVESLKLSDKDFKDLVTDFPELIKGT